MIKSFKNGVDFHSPLDLGEVEAVEARSRLLLHPLDTQAREETAKRKRRGKGWFESVKSDTGISR